MTAELNGGHSSLRPAWKLSDGNIARDAKALWQRLTTLGPEEAERRVSELCAAAYSDDAMVGVATAYIERLEMLKARFAFFRCLVVPGERRIEIARSLALLSRDLLERWSLENPSEEILGMAAMIPPNAYGEKQRDPVWAEGGLNLNLVGYSRRDEQIRVSWFEHARVS